MSFLDGTRAIVTGDVIDIGRRINEGDPTVGWEGDPTMALVIDDEPYQTDPDGRPVYPLIPNLRYGWFEVWGTDAHGEAYLAASSPTCDQNLLKALADGHWKRGSAHDRIVAENTRRAQAIAKEKAAEREEIADKLAFALHRDLGAYEGGLSRRIY